MSALDTEPFPRFALLSAGALVGLSLIATTAVRLTRTLSPQAPPALAAAAAPVAFIDLRFQDQADGSIRITRADGAGTFVTAGVVHPGEGGFIRGVMRGLARDRISRHIGEAPPFRLSLSQAGTLSLRDTATGRDIDLESFGASNRDAFFTLIRPELSRHATATAAGPTAL